MIISFEPQGGYEIVEAWKKYIEAKENRSQTIIMIPRRLLP